jgi:hypothetical protein
MGRGAGAAEVENVVKRKEEELASDPLVPESQATTTELMLVSALKDSGPTAPPDVEIIGEERRLERVLVKTKSVLASESARTVLSLSPGTAFTVKLKFPEPVRNKPAS